MKIGQLARRASLNAYRYSPTTKNAAFSLRPSASAASAVIPPTPSTVSFSSVSPPNMDFTLAEIKLFLSGLRDNTRVGPRWKKLAARKLTEVRTKHRPLLQTQNPSPGPPPLSLPLTPVLRSAPQPQRKPPLPQEHTALGLCFSRRMDRAPLAHLKLHRWHLRGNFRILSPHFSISSKARLLRRERDVIFEISLLGFAGFWASSPSSLIWTASVLPLRARMQADLHIGPAAWVGSLGSSPLPTRHLKFPRDLWRTVTAREEF